MTNPFNTLFGRLACLTVGLVVVVHLTSLFLVEAARGHLAASHISGVVSLVNQSRQQRSVDARTVADTLGVATLDTNDPIAYGCPAPCENSMGPFERDLRHSLPAGSHVVFDSSSGQLWVRYAGQDNWLVLRDVNVPLRRFFGASAVMLVFAVMAALIGAWQFQQPLRRLADAAREFRIGRPPAPVPRSGPSEVKDLISDFNRMVQDLTHAEHERSVMVAGVAHDLRTPITRLQVRADLLHEEAIREAFLRDTDALGRIVNQFLDFARGAADRSPLIGVDAHCARNYGDTLGADAPIRLRLRAGEEFKLPQADLDRILSNLIENALTYGDAPVEVDTAEIGGQYVLTVRDQGPGIPLEQLEQAQRPFVRLDAARSGNAHCGLGLAIVKRLVLFNGGTFEVGNPPTGGFAVTMTFPA